MNKEKVFEVTIRETINEDLLSGLLSNASSSTCGFDFWQVEREQDYVDAAAELREERGLTDHEICIEDIWARVLFNGGHLLLLESESDAIDDYESPDWHRIGLEDICNGITQYLRERPCSECSSLLEIVDEGDFWDADAVMQYAAYKEIIFG